MLFSDFKGMDSSIVKALDEVGIKEPTDIQIEAIPKILNTDSHIMAQAKTGSGKTLAFSIPVAEKIDIENKNVQALILVPTRELSKQTYKEIKKLSKYRNIKTVKVYGGVSIGEQITKINNGAHIVTATPGRLIDLYKRKDINFDHIKYVVLDEADRMLDMGFFPDIEYILLEAMKNVSPRLLCFSATMLEEIDNLSSKFTKGEKIIKINLSEDDLTVENCKQYYYLIDEFRDKIYNFMRILKKERPKHCMIFVNTIKTGHWLYKRLKERKDLNLNIDVITGDLSQNQREKVLGNFTSGKINCLIATDVAARGLDIPNVSHVFNYDIPEYDEVYVHRIGRTARISSDTGETKEGIAISLVLKKQYNLLTRIEGYQDKEIKRLALPQRGNKKNYQKENKNYSRGSRSDLNKQNKKSRRRFLY